MQGDIMWTSTLVWYVQGPLGHACHCMRSDSAQQDGWWPKHYTCSTYLEIGPSFSVGALLVLQRLDATLLMTMPTCAARYSCDDIGLLAYWHGAWLVKCLAEYLHEALSISDI